MSRYLITGAQGFLGRYLATYLLETEPDARVVGVGRSPRNDSSFTHSIQLGQRHVVAPLPANIVHAVTGSRYEYASVDLLQATEATSLVRRSSPDVIFHLASGLRDDPCENLCRTNIQATAGLLDGVAQAQLKGCRLVFSSSGGVYGIPAENNLPIQEDSSLAPNDLYSVTKLAAEHILRMSCHRAGMPLRIGRVFNVVGPGQNERHVCGRIVSQLVSISREGSSRCVEVGSLSPTRDFVDVRDVAAALAVIAQSDLDSEVFNIATGIETSIESLLESALELTELHGKVLIHHLPERVADIPRHFGSVARLRAAGFTPMHTLRDSLADIVDYYRSLSRESTRQECA